jgi:hypothetical protein
MKEETNPLIGTWKAKSFVVKRKNQTLHYPFGDNPGGQLVYTKEGRFSTQLRQRGRIPVKSGDIMDASHEEMAANFRGFISYYGTFDFDPKNMVVLHHVKGSLFPNWENDSLKRNVRLEGNQLELTTEPTFYGSEDIVASVVWERID